MLQIYRRHLKSCSHTSRSYRRCPCPIWVQGTLGGETIRRAMDVTSIEAASNLVAQWNAAGRRLADGDLRLRRYQPLAALQLRDPLPRARKESRGGHRGVKPAQQR